MNNNHESASDSSHESREENISAMLEQEIRNLSARLRKSELGKSQFLSNVRNEINNPMASIIGLAASIHGLTAEEKVKTMSALIHKQASQLDFQMRNIIMAAEIELGELRTAPSRINVNSLVDDQIRYFNHSIAENDVKVTVRLDDHLRFHSDSQILQVICLNLIGNAIEFAGDLKQVLIEGKIVEGKLEISIKDFGTGLTDMQKEQIFQRFNQLESGVCKKHKGHGLGLCIVNELINHLGGSLKIDSKVGVGTTVKFCIPEMVAAPDGKTWSSNGNESLFTVDEEF